MDTSRIAHHHAPFTLHRVHTDGSSTPVPGTETTDRIEATETAFRLLREHPGAAFTLFHGSTTIAKFGHKALKLRLSLGAVEMMAG